MQGNNMDFDISLDKSSEDPGKDSMYPKNDESTSLKTNTTDLSKIRSQPRGNPKSACAILTFEYWQPYFLFEQEEIKTRLLESLNCLKANDFARQIKDSPDLYGPFWISTCFIFFCILGSSFSLVIRRLFFTAVSVVSSSEAEATKSNLKEGSNGATNKNLSASTSLSTIISYDFSNLGYSCWVVYGFLICFPAALTLALKFLGTTEYSLIKVVVANSRTLLFLDTVE